MKRAQISCPAVKILCDPGKVRPGIDLPPPGGYRFLQLPPTIKTCMPHLPSESVYVLLARWSRGDQQALDDLVPLIYNELHAMAHYYLRGERSDHTLQTTALIHEAYLRLAQQGPFPTENRSHFVAIAATLMRQILVDYARNHRANKRGADCTIRLEDNIDPAPDNEKDVDVLLLDDALSQLARRDPQQSRIVELRFFAGMTVEETAAVIGVSAATVKRDWSMARAWLSRHIKRGNSGNQGRMAKG
jgi:RNA polymerase sigma factor (TIGR02999 family)